MSIVRPLSHGAMGEVYEARPRGGEARVALKRCLDPDNEERFEIEGRLDAMPRAVQPGLQGVAKIHAGEHNLAWIWTHRLVDWARLKLWAWAP